jgi:hypothetical protein
MGLYEQRFEKPFIRLNLPLEFSILLRTKTRLSLVRDDLIDVKFGSICS